MANPNRDEHRGSRDDAHGGQPDRPRVNEATPDWLSGEWLGANPLERMTEVGGGLPALIGILRKARPHQAIE